MNAKFAVLFVAPFLSFHNVGASDDDIAAGLTGFADGFRQSFTNAYQMRLEAENQQALQRQAIEYQAEQDRVIAEQNRATYQKIYDRAYDEAIKDIEALAIESENRMLAKEKAVFELADVDKRCPHLLVMTYSFGLGRENTIKVKNALENGLTIYVDYSKNLVFVKSTTENGEETWK